MSLLITLLLGIFILIGILVVKISNQKKIIEQLSISIALGTMISLILSDLIPEVMEKMNNITLIIVFVLIGIFLLKILDLFIPEHDSEHGFDHNCSNENLIHIGIVSSVAIILHNIIEGMAIYGLVISDIKLGLLVALGVGLHNIPMGMIIYTTLQNEDKNKKIVLITLTTISTFIGGILMMLINNILNEFVIGILISITLGMLIYIILFELIPHLAHSKNKKLSIFGIILGIIIIFISSFIE